MRISEGYDDLEATSTTRVNMLLDRREFLELVGLGLASCSSAAFALASNDEPAQPVEKPNHRAIVIAVQQTPGADKLPHAAQEARDFVRWLITKGGVKPDNIQFLVSPDQLLPHGQSTTFMGVKLVEATGNAISDGVEAIMKSQAGVEDRLYFYFTGHGVMSRSPLQTGFPNDALVPSDYHPGHSAPISLASIARSYSFNLSRQQFFIVDACRQIGGLMDTRGIPAPDIDPSYLHVGRPYVQHFLYPVRPGEVTFDRGKFDGSFASVLLSGLTHGQNSAWTWIAPSYRVCWNRLVFAVSSYFKKNPKVVRKQGQELDVITPYHFEWPLGADDPDETRFEGPLMTELSLTDFPAVQVTLKIEPPEARANARLTLSANGVRDIQLKYEGADDSICVCLPPLTYKLKVECPGYVTDDSTRVNPEDTPDVPPIQLRKDTGGEVNFNPGKGEEKTDLTVTSTDPFAEIVVSDSDGVTFTARNHPHYERTYGKLEIKGVAEREIHGDGL